MKNLRGTWLWLVMVWIKMNALMVGALYLISKYGRDIGRIRKAIRAGELGAISMNNAVEVLIMVFIAFVILYQLIPWVSDQNTTVQSSDNVSAMGKFSAGLGEWLFPLFGILALVFLLWKRRGGKREKT